MGRGLSPLQSRILGALDRWPPVHQARHLEQWARPTDIIEQLELPKTASTAGNASEASGDDHW
jgi:hypothetical protein